MASRVALVAALAVGLIALARPSAAYEPEGMFDDDDSQNPTTRCINHKIINWDDDKCKADLAAIANGGTNATEANTYPEMERLYRTANKDGFADYVACINNATQPAGGCEFTMVAGRAAYDVTCLLLPGSWQSCSLTYGVTGTGIASDYKTSFDRAVCVPKSCDISDRQSFSTDCGTDTDPWPLPTADFHAMPGVAASATAARRLQGAGAITSVGVTCLSNSDIGKIIAIAVGSFVVVVCGLVVLIRCICCRKSQTTYVVVGGGGGGYAPPNYGP
uniref:Uncharacterized protein n=1 Tax=Bicosoecida sp. CB-2014 TaxID=1486930 RepID=A0A7S1G907_9STRA|mmetsp:Transcript_25331/g.88426  ORF Transcript_25331/g.88426 Transcript_25331/m.88426 type:complete len:275 (+) Transcript_25331:172-996(+)